MEHFEVREPHYFSITDFIKALFGSIFIAVMFLFKGSLANYALKLSDKHIFVLFLFTALMVSLEIYILSYKFVRDRKSRPFAEFWMKRFFAITVSAFCAVYVCIYLYGINNFYTSTEIFKLAVAIFFPAATVGAAIEILKKSD